MSIVIVAAADLGRVIGRHNRLPWHLPSDLKRFRSVTMGRAVVMGRRTFESIGRALPGRSNVVISRDAAYRAEGCEMAPSLAAAIELGARHHDEVMIIGGAQVYDDALAVADRILLTVVHDRFEGDAWFPILPLGSWIVAGEQHVPDAKHSATYYDLRRRHAAAAGESALAEFAWPAGPP